jgi:hypothetical protein
MECKGKWEEDERFRGLASSWVWLGFWAASIHQPHYEYEIPTCKTHPNRERLEGYESHWTLYLCSPVEEVLPKLVTLHMSPIFIVCELRQETSSQPRAMNVWPVGPSF